MYLLIDYVEIKVSDFFFFLPDIKTNLIVVIFLYTEFHHHYTWGPTCFCLLGVIDLIKLGVSANEDKPLILDCLIFLDKDAWWHQSSPLALLAQRKLISWSGVVWGIVFRPSRTWYDVWSLPELMQRLINIHYSHWTQGSEMPLREKSTKSRPRNRAHFLLFLSLFSMINYLFEREKVEFTTWWCSSWCTVELRFSCINYSTWSD